MLKVLRERLGVGIGVLEWIGRNPSFLRNKLVTCCREWTQMHLKKMKKMRLRMLMETKRRLSFCKREAKGLGFLY